MRPGWGDSPGTPPVAEYSNAVLFRGLVWPMSIFFLENKKRYDNRFIAVPTIFFCRVRKFNKLNKKKL